MSDEIDYTDAEFEIKLLNKKLLEVESENAKMKQVIIDNDLEDELDDLETMSTEEYICVKGIDHLKNLYETGTFDKSDTQQLEILVKVLHQIRGKTPSTGKSTKIKTDNVAELFKLAKG